MIEIDDMFKTVVKVTGDPWDWFVLRRILRGTPYRTEWDLFSVTFVITCSCAEAVKIIEKLLAANFFPRGA